MTRRGAGIGLVLSAAIVLLATAGHAQPPPPPPPGMPDYVQELDRLYNDRDLDGFLRMFSDDVQVFSDDKLIISGRGELKRSIEAEFDKNLHIQSYSWAQGNQILVMQQVQGCIPIHPIPNAIYHGCPRARAVRYDLGGAKGYVITVAHILPAEAWNMHPATEVRGR